SGDAVALEPRVDSHLPDEDGGGVIRQEIAGNPADGCAAGQWLGNDAGAREMVTLEEVAIQGILVERLAGTDQASDRYSVLWPGSAESHRKRSFPHGSDVDWRHGAPLSRRADITDNEL